ncbi:MAG: SIS domain-containing protein [Planctomycetota bacterium]|nr:SIS domain-containing protein [Planctomycetota bacterium]
MKKDSILNVNDKMFNEENSKRFPMKKDSIKYFWYSYKTLMARGLLFRAPEQAIDFTLAIINASRIYIMGNGGSLSTANHIALDWSKQGGKSVIPLTGAESIAAYANDIGYEDVFIKQLNQYGITDKDVIVLISTSGNSPNIIKVVKHYSGKCPIVGMTGHSGYLKDTLEVVLPVNSDDPQVIEDAHLCYGHVVTNVLKAVRGIPKTV